jgi:hypothetical protein
MVIFLPKKFYLKVVSAHNVLTVVLSELQKAVFANGLEIKK